MVEIRVTKEYRDWYASLRDQQARARIDIRLRRIEHFANFGDFKHVGDDVHELRIDHGPGYRVYFVRQGDVVIVLLVGGDKSSQARDIKRAQQIARDL